MKKFALILAALLVLVASFAVAEEVDTYASASLTKSYVEGEELAALAEVLTASGADRQATSYYFVADVLSVEKTNSLIF